MKSIFQSKVFWIATVQALIGASVIYNTNLPEFAGQFLIAKSILDIILRFLTTEPVTL